MKKRKGRSVLRVKIFNSMANKGKGKNSVFKFNRVVDQMSGMGKKIGTKPFK